MIFVYHKFFGIILVFDPEELRTLRLIFYQLRIAIIFGISAIFNKKNTVRTDIPLAILSATSFYIVIAILNFFNRSLRLGFKVIATIFYFMIMALCFASLVYRMQRTANDQLDTD